MQINTPLNKSFIIKILIVHILSIFTNFSLAACKDGAANSNLDVGEECDLGSLNDPEIFNDAGVYSNSTSGCTADCKVKNIEGWDCSGAAGGLPDNDKGQSYEEMTTASNSTDINTLVNTGSMLELYDFLIKSSLTSDPSLENATLSGKLNTSITVPALTDTGCNDGTDECNNYRKAFARFFTLNTNISLNSLQSDLCVDNEINLSSKDLTIFPSGNGLFTLPVKCGERTCNVLWADQRLQSTQGDCKLAASGFIYHTCKAYYGSEVGGSIVACPTTGDGTIEIQCNNHDNLIMTAKEIVNLPKNGDSFSGLEIFIGHNIGNNQMFKDSPSGCFGESNN